MPGALPQLLALDLLLWYQHDMRVSNVPLLPLETTHFVRDHCLCLHVQRAARARGRRFDEALRPAGLSHGPFSHLMSLNRLAPASVGPLAAHLAMDRTALTANLKPLERRGMVSVAVDSADRWGRLLTLTDAGHASLCAALPLWRRTHDEVERQLPPRGRGRLRTGLRALARAKPPPRENGATA